MTIHKNENAKIIGIHIIPYQTQQEKGPHKTGKVPLPLH